MDREILGFILSPLIFYLPPKLSVDCSENFEIMSTDIATEKPEAAPSSAALTEDHAAAKTEEGSAEKDVEMGDDERKDLLKACRQGVSLGNFLRIPSDCQNSGILLRRLQSTI